MANNGRINVVSPPPATVSSIILGWELKVHTETEEKSRIEAQIEEMSKETKILKGKAVELNKEKKIYSDIIEDSETSKYLISTIPFIISVRYSSSNPPLLLSLSLSLS